MKQVPNYRDLFHLVKPVKKNCIIAEPGTYLINGKGC